MLVIVTLCVLLMVVVMMMAVMKIIMVITITYYYDYDDFEDDGDDHDYTTPRLSVSEWLPIKLPIVTQLLMTHHYGTVANEHDDDDDYHTHTHTRTHRYCNCHRKSLALPIAAIAKFRKQVAVQTIDCQWYGVLDISTAHPTPRPPKKPLQRTLVSPMNSI